VSLACAWAMKTSTTKTDCRMTDETQRTGYSFWETCYENSIPVCAKPTSPTFDSFNGRFATAARKSALV
jgi:hypothetical protein